jgi:uncharacterized protein (TIGR00297 family)
MNFDLTRFLTSVVAAVLVSAVAYKAQTLNKLGAVAAALLGILTFGLGGLSWAVLLLGFFISSSVLSRIQKKQKTNLGEKFSKESVRDAGQVLANGGIAGFLALLNLFYPGADWIWMAYAGTLAAVNADTWATELGVLSKNSPHLINNWKKVERGASGAITLTGTLAALGGSLFIAVLATGFWDSWQSDPVLPLIVLKLTIITISGLAGSMIDSLLGATIQAIYFCPACQKETERHPFHLCGSPTELTRGWKWMSNDWVNTFCALTGALMAILLLVLIY